MDILDLLKPRGGYPQKGTYRRYQSDSPEYFDYKEVNYPSARFGQIINNLITSDETQVIETPQNLDYAVGGFIVLQDGTAWTITTLESLHSNEENLRIWAITPSEKYVIGLQNIDNARRLK